MARELPIQNGRLTTDLDADGHKIKNLSGGTSSISWDDVTGKPTFANVATSGSYNDLRNKPTIPAPVTVDSALSATSTNPVQNKVVKAALDARPTKAQIDAGWWSEQWTFSSQPSSYPDEVYAVRSDELDGWGLYVVVPGQSIEQGQAPVSYDMESGPDAVSLTFQNGVKARRSKIAGPTPIKTSDLTNDGPDGAHPFLTSHQTWSDVKPSGGIQKTDLASAVQTSLGLADTAVQPAGIAGLMPMYPFETKTPALTDWSYSWPEGAQAASFQEVSYSSGTWTFSNLENPQITVSGAEDATTLTFNAHDIGGTTYEVTATRTWQLTVSPYTVATYAATSTAAAFEIAVGALPTGVTGKARDCILVIDCTATGAVAPTVTWGTHFHPRTDTSTDLAIVEAGKRAVFYISEYMPGEFAVGGWVETAGGSGT